MNVQMFRFSLLPLDSLQLSIFASDETIGNLPQSVEELIERKNSILLAVLPSAIDSFRHYGKTLIGRVLNGDSERFIIEIAIERSVVYDPEPFSPREISPDWPSFQIYVDNEPEAQLMAIEVSYRTYPDARTFTKSLETAINAELRRYGLLITVLPIYREADFWRFAAANRGKITEVKFDLFVPNRKSITDAFSEEWLRGAKTQTNAQKVGYSLRSDPKTALHIEPDNQFVAPAVQRAADGGGDMSAKADGKRVHFGKKALTVTRERYTITGDDPESVLKAVEAIARLRDEELSD